MEIGLDGGPDDLAFGFGEAGPSGAAADSCSAGAKGQDLAEEGVSAANG